MFINKDFCFYSLKSLSVHIVNNTEMVYSYYIQAIDFLNTRIWDYIDNVNSHMPPAFMTVPEYLWLMKLGNTKNARCQTFLFIQLASSPPR